MYGIWHARNDTKWNLKVHIVQYMVKWTIDIVRRRISLVLSKESSQRDMTWFYTM